MTNVSRFRIGDRVINKYNQHGTVTGHADGFTRVQVDGLQYDGGWYESNLRFETEPAPVNPESKLGFTVGQRVKILDARGYTSLYGCDGVVTGFKPSIGYYGQAGEITFVEVTTDKGVKGGWLPASLELVAPVTPVNNSIKDVWDAPAPALTPNQLVCGTAQALEKGARAKYAGQNAAISKNSEVYRIAKDIAVELGRNWKQVNIDMVQGVLVSRGYKAADLGNAAGAIFRGKNWKDTGTTHLSRRESNHARRITVWAYVGA